MTTQKKLYQAVISYRHPQQVIMNIEEETLEAAKTFIHKYLSDKLESFEILEIEEVSRVPEDLQELEEPADDAEVIPFPIPGTNTIH